MKLPRTIPVFSSTLVLLLTATTSLVFHKPANAQEDKNQIEPGVIVLPKNWQPPDIMSKERFVNIFAPLQSSKATLSPNGKHFAFSWRDEKEKTLSVLMMDVDNPIEIVSGATVLTDKLSVDRGRPAPAAVIWMGWHYNENLLVTTNRGTVTPNLQIVTGDLVLVSRNPENTRILTLPRDFQMPFMGYPQPIQPLGFSPLNRNYLLVQGGARAAGTTYRSRINVLTGKGEHVEATYKAMRYNHAHKRMEAIMTTEEEDMLYRQREAEPSSLDKLPGYKEAKAELDGLLGPGRIDMLEADTALNRFLIRNQDVISPGAYTVYDRTLKKAWNLVRRAEHLEPLETHSIERFNYSEADGHELSGIIIKPKMQRTARAPLVVVCPGGYGAKISLSYDPQMRALAEMGFAIALLNGCAANGKSTECEIQQERRQASDILKAIDYLAKDHAVSRKSVALFGTGNASYIAARTLQLYPGRFRCGVALTPRVLWEQWREEARWKVIPGKPELGGSEAKRLPTINEPLFVAGTYGQFTDYDELRRFMNANRKYIERMQVSDDYNKKLPQAQAKVFQRIEQFLTSQLYNYSVELGEMIKVEEQKPKNENK